MENKTQTFNRILESVFGSDPKTSTAEKAFYVTEHADHYLQAGRKVWLFQDFKAIRDGFVTEQTTEIELRSQLETLRKNIRQRCIGKHAERSESFDFG